MSDSTDPGCTGDGFDDPTAPAWTSPEPAPPTQPITDRATGAPAVPLCRAAARAGDGPVHPGPVGRPLRPEPLRPEPLRPEPLRPEPVRAAASNSRTTAPAYGQTPYAQPYGSTAYGQAPYSLPPAPYGAPPVKNTSAIVLTVVSAHRHRRCAACSACPRWSSASSRLTKPVHRPAGLRPDGPLRLDHLRG